MYSTEEGFNVAPRPSARHLGCVAGCGLYRCGLYLEHAI